MLLTGTFGWYPEHKGGSGGTTEGNRAAFEAKFATIAGDTQGVALLNDLDGSDKFLGGERIPGMPTDMPPVEDTISGGVLASGDPQGLNEDGLHRTTWAST